MDDDNNDDISDASDEDDPSILGEDNSNSDDDISTHDGGSELNSEIGDDDEDDTLMGSEEDEVSEDEHDDSGCDNDNDDTKSIDGMSVDSRGSGRIRGQKRKFVDFDDQLDSINQSLRSLKRLAGAKLENDASDETDGILSNEDFQRIKELKVSCITRPNIILQPYEVQN